MRCPPPLRYDPPVPRTPPSVWDRVERLLDRVEKPVQYVGGEVNEVRKDPRSVEVRVALAFPDTYAIGMSHLGLRILYGLLNERPEYFVFNNPEKRNGGDRHNDGRSLHGGPRHPCGRRLLFAPAKKDRLAKGGGEHHGEARRKQREGRPCAGSRRRLQHEELTDEGRKGGRSHEGEQTCDHGGAP